MILSRKLLKILSADIIAFAGIQSVSVTVVYGLYRSMEAAHWSYALLAVGFLLLWLRNKIKSLALFAAIGLAVILPVTLLAQGLVAKLFLSLLVAAQVLYSAFRVGKDVLDDEESALAAALLITLAMSVVSSLFDQPELYSLYLAHTLVISLSFLTHRHIKRVDHSMSHLTMTTKQSASEILRFNNRMLVAFLCIVAACTALFPMVPIEVAFYALRSVAIGLVMILTFLFRLDKFEEPDEVPLEEEELVQDELVPDEELIYDSTELISQIVFFTVGTIVVILAIITIVKWLRELKQRLAQNRPDSEPKSPEPEIIVEKLRRTFLPGKRRPRFGVGPAAKIRKLYYKKVRRHILTGVSVSRSDAPDGICKKIAAVEDIAQLTEQYKMARYSDKL